MSADRQIRHTLLIATVWLLRIAVGGVFIVSGFAKLDDLWGTVFKIEDYLSVWNLDFPRTIVMMGALALSTFEFVIGLLLATGCYRRSITWFPALLMLFMLPLTLYIWIADPVEDCGCFGDFIILSNAATFWKNVVLTLMIVLLIIYNRYARPVFAAPIQWIVTTLAVLYSLIVALYGYNVQPLLDFRPFGVGTVMYAADNDDESDDDVNYLYRKGETTRVFSIDNLPDEEDGWEFVERIETPSDQSATNTIAAYDPISADDVTDIYMEGADSLLILVIPEPSRADLSNTYTINELNDAVSNSGGNVVALLATDSLGVERWQDHSMASYPCLISDDTELKQLARGVMSMVWITGDTIRWKRTVASIGHDDVERIVAGERTVSSLAIDERLIFMRLTAGLCILLVVIYLLQTAIMQIPFIARKK